MGIPLDKDFQGDVGTDVLKRALEWREALLLRLRTGIGPIGYEKTPTRTVRASVRKAMEGDDLAMIEMAGFAVDNGHDEGEGKPCALCEQVDIVMKEMN